jgi:hypothetical protein
LKQYREQCVKFLQRLKASSENSKLEITMTRVLEIMNGLRVVDIKLLERLEHNVRTTLINKNPSRHLLEIAKKVAELAPVADEVTIPSPLFKDPWRAVRHLEIRVPEALRNLVAEEEKNRINRKRKSDQSRADADENRTRGVADTKVEPEEDDDEDIIKIPCFTSGNYAEFPIDASKELQQYNYRFDPDYAPISQYSANFQVFVDYKPSTHEDGFFGKRVAPLRLLIPRDYPKEPAQLFHDITDISKDGDVVLERMKLRMDTMNLRKVTDIVETWQMLVAQYLKELAMKATTTAGYNISIKSEA